MVTQSAARLDSVFHALADPTRRRILEDLQLREHSVGEIAKPHRMSLAAVSKHLKVLESAELIARERRGAFQIVRLNAQNLQGAEQWLSHYARFWSTKLNQLEQFLEKDPKS